ncbi:kinase-like domain-containing protein [Glomus cerebriforme]|uniref:Kinase-like domain-containing protein n=1 Tax=Glomus cerebriforme TaxID=658196 RepID=A0A397SJ38_9GLOM|nr:kinase-like domain-containing protein [Glomus cerebriforme]
MKGIKLDMKTERKLALDEKFYPEVLRLEECGTDRLRILVDGETSQTIHYYDPQGFNNITEIASGGTSLVYAAYWKNTSKFVIKKFVKSLTKEVINEIYLTEMVNSHPNIIQFYGVTNLKGEINYSLVLDYADGGTLEKYLRDSAITFNWESQLKFAKEIANAISWLHADKGIIHGDLHTIKLADFGRSCLQESDGYIKAYGVIPYVDPILFNNESHLTKKSDIYSLGVLFWELMSRSSPFNFEKRNDHGSIILGIYNGMREDRIQGTKCWRHEPDERPNIHQVISELKSINSGNNSVSNKFAPSNVALQLKKGKTTEKLENEDFDLSNCDRDCDLSKILD